LFLGHKLLTTNARKRIKGTKDAKFRLVSIQKEEQFPLVLGPKAWWRKPKKPKPFRNMTSLRKLSNPNFPIFLSQK